MISIMLIDSFLFILYSGFLFPSFFAFHQMSTISIPAMDPPNAPVRSRTLKKAFFMLDAIINIDIIKAIKQDRIQDNPFFIL